MAAFAQGSEIVHLIGTAMTACAPVVDVQVGSAPVLSASVAVPLQHSDSGFNPGRLFWGGLSIPEVREGFLEAVGSGRRFRQIWMWVGARVVDVAAQISQLVGKAVNDI